MPSTHRAGHRPASPARVSSPLPTPQAPIRARFFPSAPPSHTPTFAARVPLLHKTSHPHQRPLSPRAPSNPHRRTPSPSSSPSAISCLGAFPTPAVSARGWDVSQASENLHRSGTSHSRIPTPLRRSPRCWRRCVTASQLTRSLTLSSRISRSIWSFYW